jgi:hypothetical protein
MAINENREAARLKVTLSSLSKDPENKDLLARKLAQEIALTRQEEAYPKSLLRHLRHCAQNGQADIKGRSKKMALDLLKGIKPPVKLGTGNG